MEPECGLRLEIEMAMTFGLEVSYGQLAVFASSLKQPFNDWTDRHVAQGFAWRPGSVSFRCLVEAGHHLIEIAVVDRLGPLDSEAVRVINVPFEVPLDGAVELGSISETIPVSLPMGLFQLRCEFFKPNSAVGARVRLTFAQMEKANFEVVRADQELSPGEVLLTTALPASG